ncbi:hypothetical protein JCM11251_000103 [Rhodosporidiobolus azoricus]
MKVSHLVELGQPLQIAEVDKPIPGPRDVLVKVMASTIVPNAYNIVSGKAPNGTILPDFPAAFGLDAAGLIEQVGADVLHLKAGDRVYVNPLLSCETCHQCRRGRKELCPSFALRAYFAYSEAGKKRLDQYPLGALSEYLLSPDTKVALLPPCIDFPTASRFGYIGTSFAALKKGGVAPGSTLLINGVTGTLGTAAVAIALGFGASKILGVGRNRDRLAEVERLSPRPGRVVVRSSEDEGELSDWVMQHTGGLGVDAVYDCLGVGGDANSTSCMVKTALKAGGKAVLAAGGAEGSVEQSYWEILTQDRAVHGSAWFTDAEADELIEMVTAGEIDFSFLKHQHFSLEEVNEAFKAAGDRPGGMVNIVVRPGRESESVAEEK